MNVNRCAITKKRLKRVLGTPLNATGEDRLVSWAAAHPDMLFTEVGLRAVVSPPGQSA